MDLLEPFSMQVAPEAPWLEAGARAYCRRISDMRAMYHDSEACEVLLAEGDPVVYEVFMAPVPEAEGHLSHGVTVVHPGRVGDEFFMTKGHYHQKAGTAEVYYGLRGSGLLLMQARQGECRAVPMGPGTVVYVPPHWGHRTVNTGPDPLVFLFAFPGDAGHDYASVESAGFAQRVLSRQGLPVLVDNPAFVPERAR